MYQNLAKGSSSLVEKKEKRKKGITHSPYPSPSLVLSPFAREVDTVERSSLARAPRGDSAENQHPGGLASK